MPNAASRGQLWEGVTDSKMPVMREGAGGERPGLCANPDRISGLGASVSVPWREGRNGGGRLRSEAGGSGYTGERVDHVAQQLAGRSRRGHRGSDGAEGDTNRFSLLGP
jgi:hypothetical protein